MLHRQDDTIPTATDPCHCAECARDFVVPISVVDLIDNDRCVVELQCMNCGTASLRVHEDRELMELDRRLDQAQAQMRESVEILEISDDLDRVDRFVRALRDDHILPEDF